MRTTNERHHRAKIPDADVKVIRHLRDRYGMSFAKIAERTGVNRHSVRDIAERRTRPE